MKRGTHRTVYTFLGMSKEDRDAWRKIGTILRGGKNPILPRISSGALILWLNLVVSSGNESQVSAGQTEVAVDTGLTREHVNTLMKELRELGLVTVQARFNEDGQQLANLYTLTVPNGEDAT